jgi:hypothetical protein
MIAILNDNLCRRCGSPPSLKADEVNLNNGDVILFWNVRCQNPSCVRHRGGSNYENEDAAWRQWRCLPMPKNNN